MWRLRQVEEGMAGLRGDLKEAVGTFGAGITALQTQLTHYQTNISEKYITRREAEDLVAEARSVRKATDERITRMGERIDQVADQQSTRAWMLTAAMLTALISAAFTAIGWLQHTAH